MGPGQNAILENPQLLECEIDMHQALSPIIKDINKEETQLEYKDESEVYRLEVSRTPAPHLSHNSIDTAAGHRGHTGDVRWGMLVPSEIPRN